MLRRRELIRNGLVSAGVIGLGPAFWDAALARPARAGIGPYGPLGAPDANGIRLPRGFSSRVIARSGLPVAGTLFQWHVFPDGAATFATREGGWILVSNSEFPSAVDLPSLPVADGLGEGGASAIRFTRRGEIESAYRILEGTTSNCAGGATPWGTWLSCEEFDEGMVWECDPTGRGAAVVHPALGVFQHEAVCVDPVRGHLYLTEDKSDGGLYRFTPGRPRDLGTGLLEIAVVGEGGHVRWRRVPDPSARAAPTREQVAVATEFQRGEGIWYDSGFVYVATTRDSKIHAYDVRRERIRVIYDPERLSSPPLTDVDNICVSRSGDLFVCEDNGGDDPLDIGLITPGPKRVVARFLKLTGSQHGTPGSEIFSETVGVCFNPTGDRMYLSSQRGFLLGVTYEISGPFRGFGGG